MIRDMAFALLSGALLALSFPISSPVESLGWLFPPHAFESLAWVALVPLLWAIDGKRPHQGFSLGFLTGLVTFGLTVWWVKISMTTYGGLAPWLSWNIAAVLAAYLALYTGLFCYVLRRIGRERGIAVFLFAAPLWVALELLRAYVLSGFPWLLLGYSQYRVLPVIQIADLVGVYGVSFLIVAVNAALWHFFRHPHRAPFAVVGGTALLAALSLGYGYFRLRELERRSPAVARPVGIVQGNIDQARKWTPGAREDILERHERLTGALAEKFRAEPQPVPPLVVWPEAAAPFLYADEEALGGRIRETARRSGTYLLFGSLRREFAGGAPRFFNSAYLVGPEGRDLGHYDKLHLAPFGEYIPMGPLLFFVQKLVPVIGTFAVGEEPHVFDVPGGKFGVLICFEAIFPRVVRRFRGAQFLVNITNDAWFGQTAASEQHLSMVALRAVEFRVPIVRAANSGISALVDARGAILERSPLFVPWSRAASVSPRGSPPSIYARTGDVFAYACALLAVLAMVVTFSRPGGRVWYD